ncbi:MAG: hypothetical protein H0W97_03130 [Actinobacteria bacterium]|nr:hypothetical protein [Actinomycetota bacterium]
MQRRRGRIPEKDHKREGCVADLRITIPNQWHAHAEDRLTGLQDPIPVHLRGVHDPL